MQKRGKDIWNRFQMCVVLTGCHFERQTLEKALGVLRQSSVRTAKYLKLQNWNSFMVRLSNHELNFHTVCHSDDSRTVYGIATR